MPTPDRPPIACTLAPGDYRTRLTWLAELARDALRGAERRGLVLELRYAPEAVERVREMVRRERECCPFLTFDLEEMAEEVRLTIRAPEAALLVAAFSWPPLAKRLGESRAVEDVGCGFACCPPRRDARP